MGRDNKRADLPFFCIDAVAAALLPGKMVPVVTKYTVKNLPVNWCYAWHSARLLAAIKGRGTSI